MSKTQTEINYSEKNEITNFRGICMGNMKNGVIYRGSYPVSRLDKKRDETYTELVLEAGINCIINLAGDEKDAEALASVAPWYNALLLKNNVIGLDIQFDFDFFDKFQYDVFNYRLRQGFKFLIARDGPYLVHCNAGTDRTGFFAAITELLFGASIDDVIYDYLLSYGKNVADTKDEKINFITGRNIYGQINAVVNGKINDSDNLRANIETYFLEKIGLTREELEALKEKLT